MFAYLIVGPRDCDLVDFADGLRRVTARGAGAALAEEAVEHPPAAAAPDARLLQHQAAHRAWAERLDRALDASRSVSHARQIREAFVAENPEPTFETASDQPPRPQVSQGRWWCAHIDHPEDGVESWLAEAEQDYPLAGVAAVLSDLGERGWELRHVAEDKQVVHDETTSRAVVVGARFLLHRPDQRTP